MTAPTSRGYPRFALTDSSDIAVKLNALADAVNDDLDAVFGGSWVNLANIGGSYSGGASPDNPQWLIRSGMVFWRGIIQKNAGNWAANATTLLIDVGNIPAAIRPPFKVDIPLSSDNPDHDLRGILTTSGSLSIITGAATGTYVALAGLSCTYPAAP